jgi:hypothetical protein
LTIAHSALIIPLNSNQNKKMKLLSKNNTKILKGEKIGVLTYGLSLAPAKLNGKVNLCLYASAGCRAACLYTSGHGAFSNVKAARMKKTMAFINAQPDFLLQLEQDIQAAIKTAKRKGMRCAIRLNVLSDVAWHEMIDFTKYPDVQFYDYTPNTPRMVSYLQGKLPVNYHLTFSRKENNQAAVEVIASMGGNVAVVFDTLPDTYLGRPVVNGDDTDVRFLDGKGVVVGLKAKGQGKKDTTNFVVLTA